MSIVDFAPLAAATAYLAGAAGSLAVRADRAPAAAAAGAALALTFAALGAGGLIAGDAPGTGVFRLDGFAATMLTLIGGVGFVVVRYADAYLDGDARRPEFMSRLCLTLAAVCVLVTANHLGLVLAGWIGMSLMLHTLLLYFPGRPRAAIAARKKFVVARIGDACLAVAALCLVAAFGTWNVSEILAASAEARAAGAAPGAVGFAAALIVAAAALKSAQFPTHGWLTEVMETPTPVSALLHAGIVNAGGFLVIRFADVVLANAGAMHALALVGGFTALFGSLVMVTRTSVKVSLAYSTVAQMGFMLLQCGLGAFSAAALHIIAHSVYKAHAFLSSGRAVVAAAKKRPTGERTSADALAAFVVALVAYVGVGALFAGLFGGAAEEPALVALGAIFLMGLAVYLSHATTTVRTLMTGGAVVAGASLAYFTLQSAAAGVLGSSVPRPPAPDAADWTVMALAVVSFGAVAFAQAISWRAPSALAGRIYVHVSRGLYANALFNRLVGAAGARPRNAAR
ncbi:MAG: proton-conducting transporter membrane subunit [Pseudomonadota bacterium]